MSFTAYCSCLSQQITLQLMHVCIAILGLCNAVTRESEQITAGMQIGSSQTAACSSCLCTPITTCMAPSHTRCSRTRGRPHSCLPATLSWPCWPWCQLYSSLSWMPEQSQHRKTMTFSRAEAEYIYQAEGGVMAMALMTGRCSRKQA